MSQHARIAISVSLAVLALTSLGLALAVFGYPRFYGRLSQRWVSRGQSGSVEFVIECELPELLAEEVPRFTVIAEPIPLDVWLAVAEEVFNMTGIRVEHKNLTYQGHQVWLIGQHEGEPSVLKVGHGGYFIWTCSAGSPHGTPDPEEARAVAATLYEKLMSYGIVPDGLDIELLGVRETSFLNGVPVEVAVVYGISYKGFEFYRPLAIYVRGPDADVVAVYAPWFFFKEDGTVAIDITVPEALEELKGLDFGSDVVKVIVHGVRLGYLNDYKEYEFLPPVYIFDITVVYEDGHSHDCGVPIPAVEL